MYSIKETSTQQANKIKAENCPVNFTLNRIGGRWKSLILFNLSKGPLRYSMIRKSIPEISEKMLIQNLKELELDQIIERQAKPIIPPHVTYALSAKGMDLIPIFNAMAHWGNQYSKTEKKESSALKPMVNPAKKDI